MSGFLTLSDGRRIQTHSPQDDAAITQAAEPDPDARPYTDARWAAVQPLVRRGGRPRVAAKRPMVSMRMDPDLLAQLRALGPGWQTRVNAGLRRLVEQGGL